jgi:predicted NBD/HSP70 family sugar kinase
VRAGLPRTAPIAALVAAAASGEPDAVRSLRIAGDALGIALANVINIVDVGHVVLGGVYARLARFLEEPILRQCRSRVLSSAWSPIGLSVAEAGEYPAMSGAALAVLRSLAKDPVALLGR